MRDKSEAVAKVTGRSTPIRILHASPTWFSPESIVGGGERWVDNVMLALAAGAPEVEQAMVAIGSSSGLTLRGRTLTRIVQNERVRQQPMEAVSSRLWGELAGFDVIHIHQSLADFGVYVCCVASSLGKTVILTDLGGGSVRSCCKVDLRWRTVLFRYPNMRTAS